MNRTDNAPTREQMWEQIVSLTDRCLHEAWQSGYYAGIIAERDSKIDISDLIEEVD